MALSAGGIMVMIAAAKLLNLISIKPRRPSALDSPLRVTTSQR
jgi:hypothetical protein